MTDTKFTCAKTACSNPVPFGGLLMKIREIELSDFSLVEVMTTNECKPTPHCKNHGAMNKITLHEDGGGIWRCISVPAIGRVKVIQSNGSFAWGSIEHDSICRAGCEEYNNG